MRFKRDDTKRAQLHIFPTGSIAKNNSVILEFKILFDFDSLMSLFFLLKWCLGSALSVQI